ncbi:MAG: type IV secretion protein IcmC [Proteobacteria bacterium]|nr:type IV secretion protein IcmC [Pseudomonadota bacterium]
MLFAGNAYAEVTSAQDMLISLNHSLGPVWHLVTGLAYILGIGFMFKAIYHLKVYGELRTMMASNTGLKEPIAYLIVGAVFAYLPTGLDIVMNTTFGSTSILQYSDWVGAGGVTNPSAMIAVFRLVQLIGVIAFIRGWVLVAQASKHGGGGQATYGKGLTHIIGGILAINIIATSNILSNTLGISFT